MAELAAAMEVDRFIERGDPAGEARARRVLSAIKALRRGAQQANETLAIGCPRATASNEAGQSAARIALGRRIVLR